MNNSPVGLLTDQFAKLTDPRTGHAKRHKLINVIVIAICAVICGADSWVDVEMFGKSKKGWLSRLLELPNGIRSHDTPAFARAGFSVGSLRCWTLFSSRSGSMRSTR